jgi:hypothetical protein
MGMFAHSDYWDDENVDVDELEYDYKSKRYKDRDGREYDQFGRLLYDPNQEE